ncbi:MAG: hypothetical protein CEE43_13090 [Promethearchaeota archaeon Loki_b32]|nr:MAG: hypothetical protein CEE43_13090 [Candidatus Lokiarchaeota archaeon Loki_b32]
MAITEAKNNVNISTTKIDFICPVCKSRKALDVPKSVIEDAKQLTTMSIARGLVCEHQFQAFVDKNYQVRGYQRVDFEFEPNVNHEKPSDFNNFKQDDNELFENLVLEGNYLEYKPKNTEYKINKSLKKQKIPTQEKKISLGEIYNEFRELIDEDNEKFRDFIENDSRRNQISLIY